MVEVSAPAHRAAGAQVWPFDDVALSELANDETFADWFNCPAAAADPRNWPAAAADPRTGPFAAVADPTGALPWITPGFGRDGADPATGPLPLAEAGPPVAQPSAQAVWIDPSAGCRGQASLGVADPPFSAHPVLRLNAVAHPRYGAMDR